MFRLFLASAAWMEVARCKRQGWPGLHKICSKRFRHLYCPLKYAVQHPVWPNNGSPLYAVQCQLLVADPLCLLGTQRTPQLEATIYLHHLTETYYCPSKPCTAVQPCVRFPKHEVSIQRSVILYISSAESAFDLLYYGTVQHF